MLLILWRAAGTKLLRRAARFRSRLWPCPIPNLPVKPIERPWAEVPPTISALKGCIVAMAHLAVIFFLTQSLPSVSLGIMEVTGNYGGRHVFSQN